jgi:hypothetical protein
MRLEQPLGELLEADVRQSASAAREIAQEESALL